MHLEVRTDLPPTSSSSSSTTLLESPTKMSETHNQNGVISAEERRKYALIIRKDKSTRLFLETVEILITDIKRLRRPLDNFWFNVDFKAVRVKQRYTKELAWQAPRSIYFVAQDLEKPTYDEGKFFTAMNEVTLYPLATFINVLLLHLQALDACKANLLRVSLRQAYPDIAQLTLPQADDAFVQALPPFLDKSLAAQAKVRRLCKEFMEEQRSFLTSLADDVGKADEGLLDVWWNAVAPYIYERRRPDAEKLKEKETFLKYLERPLVYLNYLNLWRREISDHYESARAKVTREEKLRFLGGIRRRVGFPINEPLHNIMCRLGQAYAGLEAEWAAVDEQNQ